MTVSLFNVLTVIAVIWFAILFLFAYLDKKDSEDAMCCFILFGSLFFAAILLYRIGSLIFLIIGG